MVLSLSCSRCETVSIEGVPPGTYSLEAWHERLGTLREQVLVRASDRAELRLIYELDSR